MRTTRTRPTAAEIQGVRGRRIPDVLGPGLDVLFCGINPSLYSAATGHHFARPGNRFWKVLHRSGFTDRLLSPHEQAELLVHGCGLTNLVARATAAAAELDEAELRRGRATLARKVARHAPLAVAVLGIGAYRQAFGRPKAAMGEQEVGIGGARLWVLPNPSGLNAHYQLPKLVDLFGELRSALG